MEIQIQKYYLTRETFLYKHLCDKFSDFPFKVNIFQSEKYFEHWLIHKFKTFHLIKH